MALLKGKKMIDIFFVCCQHKMSNNASLKYLKFLSTFYSQTEGQSEPRNLTVLSWWAAEFCELARGIWQNLPSKTVDPSHTAVTCPQDIGTPQPKHTHSLQIAAMLPMSSWGDFPERFRLLPNYFGILVINYHLQWAW